MKTTKKTILIGIAGGGASGKASIPAQLREHYKDTDSAVIIHQDDYYKDQSEKMVEERVKTNYDHPFALDNELLVVQLQRPLQHQPICKPTYDFVHHVRSEAVEGIGPSDVAVIEGLFVPEDKDLRNLCDIKIFVNTDVDICFIRRLLRDANERGRTLESVMEQYISTVRDMHNLLIELSKYYANVIIPEGDHNVVAIGLLTMKISSIISENVI